MRKKQLARLKKWGDGKPQPVCYNCGQKGKHFVPPSFGEQGFFICSKTK